MKEMKIMQMKLVVVVKLTEILSVGEYNVLVCGMPIYIMKDEYGSNGSKDKEWIKHWKDRSWTLS